jgi:hypothetical protein
MGCGNVYTNKEENFKNVNSLGLQSNLNSDLLIFVDTSGGKLVQRKTSQSSTAKSFKQKGKK